MNEKYFIDEGIKLVSRIAEVSGVDLNDKSRKRVYVLARFGLMAKFKHTFPVSAYESATLANIGAIFGKDHSTVSHAMKVYENAIESKDPWDEYLIRFYNEYDYMFDKMKDNITLTKRERERVEKEIGYTHDRINKLEKRLNMAMSFFIEASSKMAEYKGKYHEEVENAEKHKKEAAQWKEQALELKSRYELIGMNHNEEREVERLKSFVA